MGLEIEQKFIVDENVFYRTEYHKNIESDLIEQAYLQNDDTVAIRVRVKNKDTASLDIKIRISDTTRTEYEYSIPMTDAIEMMKNVYIIRKRRYNLGNHLTVDEFLGPLSGLYLGEKEFTYEEEMETFEIPSWCIRDVTNNPQYVNCNLMNKKYVDGNIIDL